MLDHSAIAAQFPFLAEADAPLAYLDSAATAQKPYVVLDALRDHLALHNANVHRGVYPLAAESDALFEGARATIGERVGRLPEETVFTKNSTEAINLVAHSWGRANVGPGDLVVTTTMEHHANIVPWQMLRDATGCELGWVEVDEQGLLDLGSLDALLARGPKLVAVTHVSNVLGTINPIVEIAKRVHDAGALLLVDGCQAAPQMDMREAVQASDFYVITGHKVYGPTGLGVLFGRRDLLAAMPPFLGGGDMIRTVTRERATWNDLPFKFEAGTPPYAEATALATAFDWLDGIGLDAVRAHEHSLVEQTLTAFAGMDDITVYGPLDADLRGALVTFAVEGVHPHDVAEILGRAGVCVRAGHHCAGPLMEELGVSSTTRASFGVHNSSADVDRLIAALGDVRRIFGD
ncbi:MAG: SufS family cysteine desulfurase [Actinobacteria bacterium]|uniref:cysteine desulfurase n=1 Tax=freshwater metagenome TaxID=449393 RepID=A0A6J7EEL3_9ZZZZ|nr:SufS family cysteine desulfurase [Actinomycetota bacterium]